MSFNVSTEELKSFHSIDRDLYTRLVTQLRRNPTQAMRVIALWLWLEEVGYPSIILSLRSLPDNVVVSVFQEAVTILNCMESETPPSPSANIPWTCSLLNQVITLHFLHDNRVRAVTAITKTVAEVCTRAFEDATVDSTAGQTVGVGTEQLQMPAIPFITHGLHPGFHPLLHFRGFEVGESSNYTPEDRTMFVTFSRGYPLTEDELRTFFQRSYGNVIEVIHMEESATNAQPLYARVVFRSSSTVAQILNGRKRVKLVIKGKHIWIRRFV